MIGFRRVLILLQWSCGLFRCFYSRDLEGLLGMSCLRADDGDDVLESRVRDEGRAMSIRTSAILKQQTSV